MAEDFDPFASGQATAVAEPPKQDSFDPFASGAAVPAPQAQKQDSFDPFTNGQAVPATPQTLGDIAMGGLKSIAEGAAVGGGGVLKGLAVYNANDATPGGIFNETGRANPLSRTGLETPYKKSANQKLEEVKKDPLYEFGSFIQDAAKDAYKKSANENEGAVSHVINKVGEAAGGFAPMVASGPLAPASIALQTAGDNVEALYNDRLAKGDTKEQAAEFAINRSKASGLVQGAIFEFLPKPLQKLGNKYIVDTIAGDAIKKFLAKRVAQATEGAVLGATTTAAGNVATDKPIGEGVATGAAGMAAINAVMPRAAMPEPAAPEPAPAAPKAPSTISAIENVTTKQSPSEANVSANEIAMKPVAPVNDAPFGSPSNPVKMPEPVTPAEKLDEVVPAAKASADATRIDQIDSELAALEAKHGPRDSFNDKTKRMEPYRAIYTRERELLAEKEKIISSAGEVNNPPTIAEINAQPPFTNDAPFGSPQNPVKMPEKPDTEAPKANAVETPSFQQAKDVSQMTPDQFFEYSKPVGEIGITEKAQQVGNGITDPKEIAWLAEQGKKASAEVKKAVEDGDYDKLGKIMLKDQFFNEAHQAATKSQPFATDAMKEAKPATKTKAQLIDDILNSKNGKPDVTAPKQLLNPGNYELRDVPIKDIGPVFGPDSINKKAVAKYMAAAKNDPIILSKVDGVLRPVDGKHRLTAAINNGEETIKAWVPVEKAAPDITPEARVQAGEARVVEAAKAGADVASEAKKAYYDELLATGEITAEEYKNQIGESPSSKPKEVSQDVPKEVPAPKAVETLAPVAAPAPPEPVLSEFKLPKELAGAKPNYSYGAKQFKLAFKSDLDKALYIIAQKKPSARDADYVKLATEHMGITEDEARAAGQEIRDQIKQMAKNGKHGETLSVPDSRLTSTPQSNAVQVQSPASVSVPTQAQASQGVGQEVRSGVAEPAAARQEVKASEAVTEPVPVGEPSEAKIKAQNNYRVSTLDDIEKSINRTLDSKSVDIGQKKALNEFMAKVVPGFPDAWKAATKDLSIPEIEDLRDRVKSFQETGRDLVKERRDEVAKQIKETSDELKSAKSMALNKSEKINQTGIRLNPFARTIAGISDLLTSVKNGYESVDQHTANRDTIFNTMDGFSKFRGAMNRIFGGTLDTAYTHEQNLKSDWKTPIQETINSGKLKTNLGLADVDKKSMERINIYAHNKMDLANPDIPNTHLADSGITPELIAQINATITPAELRFYEAARKVLDQQVGPAVRDVMHSGFNVDVGQIKDYWPTQVIERKSLSKSAIGEKIKGEAGAEASISDLIDGLRQDVTGRPSSKVNQGISIEKQEGAGGKINLSENLIDRHINQAAHLVSHAEDLTNLAKIARADWFREKYGDRGQKYTLDLLDSVARDSDPAGSRRIPVVDAITKNYAVAILALRVFSQLKHVSNIAYAVNEVGPSSLGRGYIDSNTQAGKAFLKKNAPEAYQRSGGETTIQELLAGNKIQRLQAATFYPERIIDRQIAGASTLGAYINELASKGVNPSDYLNRPVDRQAMNQALITARKIVTSSLRKDSPQAVSRGALTGGSMNLSRAALQFQQTALRQIHYAKTELLDEGLKKGDVANASKAVAAILAALVIENTMVQGSKSITGSKPQKGDNNSFPEEMAGEAVRKIPGVGNLLAASQHGETGVPSIDLTTRGLHSIGNLYSGTNDFGGRLSPLQLKKSKIDALTFGASLAGVPGATTLGQYFKNAK